VRVPISDVLAAGYASPARPAYSALRDYRDGRHYLKFATPDFSLRHQGLLQGLRENLCPAVISGFVDTLELETWGGKAADERAEALGLSRMLGLLVQEAWAMGDAYCVVWPNRAGVDTPRFFKAAHMSPAVDPEDPSQLAHLVRRWIQPDGYGRATVYYPDRVERFVTVAKVVHPDVSGTPTWPGKPEGWAPFSGDGDPEVIGHNYGGVPGVWLKLDATDTEGYGTSILTDVIPLQDALNKALADLIVLGEAYSRPFWYLLNHHAGQSSGPIANPYDRTPALPAPGAWDPSSDTPAPVQPITVPQGISANPNGGRFDPTRQRIFTTSGEGPFGQLDPPNAQHVLEIHREYAAKVARVVGIPSYYFTQTSGDVPSGESLRVLSARRTARVRRFQSDSLPVLRGLGQLLGITDAAPAWAPVQDLDPLEVWQVAEIQRGLGIPLADVLRMAGQADWEELAARAQATGNTTASEIGAAMRRGDLTF
jgi:hypothetical protein